MKLVLKIFLALTISSNFAFAHGEDKLGPHNGFIKMPGTFHTELVPNNEDSFSIYLMDVNNSNPLVKDSSVQLKYVYKKKENKFKCSPSDDHFTCKLTQKINVKKGKLILNAVRSSVKSSDAIYELPLKLKVKDKEHDMSKM